MVNQRTARKLLTRRLKKLIDEKDELEEENTGLTPSKIQLLKVDQISHIAETFRRTGLSSKVVQEKPKIFLSRRELNPELLEMKKKFVKIYLNLKEKIPIAQELKASGNLNFNGF